MIKLDTKYRLKIISEFENISNQFFDISNGINQNQDIADKRFHLHLMQQDLENCETIINKIKNSQMPKPLTNHLVRLENMKYVGEQFGIKKNFNVYVANIDEEIPELTEHKVQVAEKHIAKLTDLGNEYLSGDFVSKSAILNSMATEIGYLQDYNDNKEYNEGVVKLKKVNEGEK